MLFDKYKDEAEFRKDFIRPLLTKLGFLAVAELDGSQEFGKDFVFSEVTAFGFMRHYGVVVKHEKAIRQTSKNLCNTILSQIRQAFSVEFRLPESSQVSHVSSVLVLNSGVITPNASTWLRSELDRERYGDNVHILDGKRLSQLDLQAAFEQHKMLMPRLLGLESSIKLNQIVWASIEESLPKFAEARGSFTQAIEDYVAAPFLTEYININEVSILLQECRIIDSINLRYLLGVRGKNEEIKTHDIEAIRKLINKAKARTHQLQLQIKICMSIFNLVSRK